MKLKQTPEDFTVDEFNHLKLQSSGAFKVYLLEKRGLETFSLLKYLSKKNNIPFSKFGYAGLKDKHALTRQHITIPSNTEIRNTQEKSFTVKFLGYSDRALRLGDLDGNRFTITVRALRKGELDGVAQKAKDIEKIGVPNYFDSQRFGSVADKEFIAKHLIKKDYEGAVRLFLTGTTKTEEAETKDDKKRIAAAWPNLTKVSVSTLSLRPIVYEYMNTHDWLAAYKQIPAELRELYVSAYQSYLWNCCVKELLIKSLPKNRLYTVKYSLGVLVFYKTLPAEELAKLPVSIKSVDENTQVSDIEAEILERVLTKEGISLQDFAIKQVTGNFFVEHDRDVLIRPKDFKISAPEVDELNDKGGKNFFKITVSFSLPRGSYATMVTKRLFNQ